MGKEQENDNNIKILFDNYLQFLLAVYSVITYFSELFIKQSGDILANVTYLRLTESPWDI